MESNTSTLSASPATKTSGSAGTAPDRLGNKPAQATRLETIPITKIRPNSDNPRGAVNPDAAHAMADSLKEVGQKTEIRVRPLTEAEKVQFPPYEYLLIGGHVRLEGARLAGLETLRAVVLEGMTPDQEALDAVLDNRWDDMGWWQWDLSIEKLLKPTNGEGQRKLAAQLGISPAKVNNAWKITQALNPAARDLVRKSVHAVNTPGSSFVLKERPVLALVDLEDPQKVEEALKVVIECQLTESQAKKLVEWMEEGHSPESYSASGNGEKGERVKNNGNDTPVGEEALSGTEVASSSTPAYSAGIPRNDEKVQTVTSKTGGFLGVLGGLLAGLFARRIANQGGLAGGIKTFLLQNLKRALGTMARRWMLHGLAAVGVVLFFSPHLFASLYHLAFGYGGSHLSTDPQVGGQALVAPSRGADGNGGAKGGSVTQTTVPAAPKANTDAASEAALDFARDYYAPDYASTSSWISNLNGELAPDYSQTFFRDFCPPSRIEELRNRKLLEQFYTTGPAQVLGANADGEDLLVQGNAVWKSDFEQPGQVLAQGPVALEVHVVHLPGDNSQGKIAWVKERTALLPPTPAPVEPEKKASKPKAGKHTSKNKKASAGSIHSMDSTSSMRGGSGLAGSPQANASQSSPANKTDDTVKTVGDTIDTADKAKKFLGF